GTLAPISRHPSESRMTERMREALSLCLKRDDTDVSVVSGRAPADVRTRFALPGLTFAANHGLEIEGPGLEPFTHPDLSHFAERSHELARALREIREPGVWLEEKGASCTP